MKILVTDYAWRDLEIERNLFAPLSAQLVAAKTGEEDELVDLAAVERLGRAIIRQEARTAGDGLVLLELRGIEGDGSGEDEPVDRLRQRGRRERTFVEPAVQVRGEQPGEVDWGRDLCRRIGLGEIRRGGVEDRVERVVVGAELEEDGHDRLGTRGARVHKVLFH